MQIQPPIASNSTYPQSAARTEPGPSPDTVEITIRPKSLLRKAREFTRVVPGTASLVAHAPWSVLTPVVSVVRPPQSEKDQLLNEVVSAGLLVGGVASAAASFFTAAGLALGFGFAAGCVAAVGTLLFTEVGEDKPMLESVLPARQKVLVRQDLDPATRAGVAFTSGAKAGFEESYERGAVLSDRSFDALAAAARFLQGTRMTVEEQ